MFAQSSFQVGMYVLFLISFLTPSHAVATCYREDTHAAMDAIYTPCNSNQPFSMCYRSQPDIYGAPPDYACLPNGITLQNNTRWGIAYWRQSCTDPTWQSPYCLNAFNDCAADANGNVQITPCGSQTSTTWCCATNPNCCDTSGSIHIAAVIADNTSSSISTTATTTSTSRVSSAISATTITITPTSSSIQNPSSGFSLSVGAKAGIAIGAVIAGVSFVGFVALLCLRRRKLPQNTYPILLQPEPHSGEMLYYVSELDPKSKHGRSELVGSERRGLEHELPGS